jgi:hypothetical protein
MVVLAVVLAVVVLLALVGLGFYAVAKKRGFKLGASFLRVISVNVEITPGTPETPVTPSRSIRPPSETRQPPGCS